VIPRTRSSLVDIGIALVKTLPTDGHVPSVSVIGQVQH